MPTYVSMVNWYGHPQPLPDDVRSAVDESDMLLRLNGLHSLALLPGEGACAAVMIATVPGENAARRLAQSILPHASIRIETMRFDDDIEMPQESHEAASPPPPRGYLEAVLEAVVAS
jgi:hypothetical protein